MNQDLKRLKEDPNAVIGSDVPVRSYEDHPDDNSEAQAAIDAVPVKDYAHYDVEIEEKDSFDGAMFADETALDEALGLSPAATAPARKATPPADYQDNANANADAQQAIEEIPVKDYASYEIEIEEKPAAEPESDAPLEFLEDIPSDSGTAAKGSAAATASPDTPDGSTQPPDQPMELDLSEFLPGSGQSGPRVNMAQGINACLAGVPSVEVGESPTLPFIDLSTINPEPEVEESVPAPKSTAEKLKRLALTRLDKTRAQADEYLGRSLPERKLPLDFVFAALKPKKEFSKPVNELDVKKLLAVKGQKPANIARQADKDLAELTRYKISDKERLAILNAYYSSIVQISRSLIKNYRRKPAIPDDVQRASLASHTEKALKYLITGYKQVYSNFYEAPAVLYGPQRATINKIAYRLLDLLVLEQTLLASLHKPLPPGTIKTFNKVFHALCHCEPWEIDKPQASQAISAQACARDLFVRYQLRQAIDYMTLSSGLHQAADDYIESLVCQVQLLPFNAGTTLTRPVWMVTHDLSIKPKLVDQSNTDTWAPIYLDASRLFNQVKQDYTSALEHLGGSDEGAIPEPLAALGMAQRASLLGELNRSVGLIESRSQLECYTTFEPLPGKAYAGIANAYGWFNYHLARRAQDPAQRNAPTNTLPDKPAAGTSQFMCAMEDATRMYLQTEEHKGTAKMDIGELVLLVREREEDEETLLLRVARVERSQSGKLDLIVEKLGDKACPVKLLQGDDATDALIVRDALGHFLLSGTDSITDTVTAQLPDNTTATLKPGTLKWISGQLQVIAI